MGSQGPIVVPPSRRSASPRVLTDHALQDSAPEQVNPSLAHGHVQVFPRGDSVDPAQAMGTFLKTWRSEWAGMSQQQLAIAVSGGMGEGKPVTRRMVQHREAGHPPETSAELVALCEVMRRNELGWAEHVDQFREAAYAACVARQYPELIGGWSIHDADGVDEIAREVYLNEADQRRGSGPLATAHIVPLVSHVKELETALREPDGVDVRPQVAALVYLRSALAVGRGGLWFRYFPDVPAMFAANAALLEAYFGIRGLGGQFSVVGQRVLEAIARAHAGHSRRWSRRLIELSREAEQLGESREAARAFLWGVHCLGELQDGAFEALESDAHRHAALAMDTDPTYLQDVECLNLLWGALGDGIEREVEDCLPDISWPHSPIGSLDVQLGQTRAWVAVKEGDWRSAERQFEEVGEFTDPLHLDYCDWMKGRGKAGSYADFRQWERQRSGPRRRD